MKNALVLMARSQKSLLPGVVKEKATCTLLMDTNSYHSAFPPHITAAHRSYANLGSDSAAALKIPPSLQTAVARGVLFIYLSIYLLI